MTSGFGDLRSIQLSYKEICFNSSKDGSARQPARIALRNATPLTRLHLARFSRSACPFARRGATELQGDLF